MSTAELKMDLISKIDVLDEQQLQELSEMVNHLINGEDDEWNSLDPEMQAKIEQGIKDIENGDVYSVESVVNEVKSKYGLK